MELQKLEASSLALALHVRELGRVDQQEQDEDEKLSLEILACCPRPHHTAFDVLGWKSRAAPAWEEREGYPGQRRHDAGCVPQASPKGRKIIFPWEGEGQMQAHQV